MVKKKTEVDVAHLFPVASLALSTLGYFSWDKRSLDGVSDEVTVSINHAFHLLVLVL
jgi:hypothetical protein